jgi:hypothetical protein
MQAPALASTQTTLQVPASFPLDVFSGKFDPIG